MRPAGGFPFVPSIILVVRMGGDVEKAKMSRKGVNELQKVQSRRANKKNDL